MSAVEGSMVRLLKVWTFQLDVGLMRQGLLAVMDCTSTKFRVNSVEFGSNSNMRVPEPNTVAMSAAERLKGIQNEFHFPLLIERLNMVRMSSIFFVQREGLVLVQDKKGLDCKVLPPVLGLVAFFGAIGDEEGGLGTNQFKGVGTLDTLDMGILQINLLYIVTTCVFTTDYYSIFYR